MKNSCLKSAFSSLHFTNATLLSWCTSSVSWITKSIRLEQHSEVCKKQSVTQPDHADLRPCPKPSPRSPVIVAASAEPTELLLLLQAGPGRAAQVFALLFGLLQDSLIGQRAQPAQQLSIHLERHTEKFWAFFLLTKQAQERQEALSSLGSHMNKQGLKKNPLNGQAVTGDRNSKGVTPGGSAGHRLSRLSAQVPNNGC